MTQSRHATIGEELETRHKKSAELYKEALNVFPTYGWPVTTGAEVLTGAADE